MRHYLIPFPIVGSWRITKREADEVVRGEEEKSEEVRNRAFGRRGGRRALLFS